MQFAGNFLDMLREYARANYFDPALITDSTVYSTVDNEAETENASVSVIVGDFQRIELYAKLGYQLPQYIPPEAWEAYHTLVAMGFDKQLAK